MKTMVPSQTSDCDGTIVMGFDLSKKYGYSRSLSSIVSLRPRACSTFSSVAIEGLAYPPSIALIILTLTPDMSASAC